MVSPCSRRDDEVFATLDATVLTKVGVSRHQAVHQNTQNAMIISSGGDTAIKTSMSESKDAPMRTVLHSEKIPEDPLDHFVSQTHAHRIDTRLLERFERLTGHQPHRYLRRGIVFCHRDLDAILDKYERGLPFYLFTGRGPSSESLHIGHSIPFEFARYLYAIVMYLPSMD